MSSKARHDLAALVPPSARRVLEVGCRTGDTGAAIKARLPGCWVAGIESHPEQAAEARRRLDDVLSDTLGQLPFPAGSFDAVVVPDALGHLPDPRPFLRVLGVLLKGDGLLIAAAPAARNVAAISRALGARESADEPSRRYTRAELVAFLTGADLVPTSLRTLRDPGMPTNPPPLDGGRIHLDLGRLVLRALSAEELEEVGASEFVVTGVRTGQVPVPECSIIVVDDDASRARECVQTVRRHPPAASREIIVVLVGITDGDVPDVAPGVRVFLNRERLGHAAARNQGARHARGHTLVFLDGAARPEPGWLDALLESARRDRGAGAVGSKRLYPDGTVAHAGIAFGGRELPWRILPYALYQNAAADASYVNRERRLSAVAGSGLLIHRAVFLAVGGFDERFESAHADIDLCLVVRSRALAVRYCPASVIVEPRDRADGDSPEEALTLYDKWAERLASDDDAICGTDGTDLSDLYGARHPRSALPGPAPVVWTGHFMERAGYAEEARSFVVALDRLGVEVQANAWLGGRPQVELPEPMGAELERLFRPTTPERFVHVLHVGPAELSRRRWRHPRAVRHILRTMFETDRIPTAWVGPCREMDELWVPTTFNVEAFAAAGVPREKLHVVPGALPTDPFDPALPPLPLPGVSGFVFLSVFGWGSRKGWELMVRAYLEEFRRDEPVTLVFHVQPFYLKTVAHHLPEIRELIAELGRKPEDGPPILVLSDTLSVTDMTRLYRAADAFVLATRGEGFGRPYLEAMAVGVPTIGTRWGGQLDFMRDDNAYLIDCTVGPMSDHLCQEYSLILRAPRVAFRDLRCAEPSVAHLRTLMRRVFEERGEAAAKAARAQAEVLDRFSWPRVAGIIAERLGLTPRRPTRRAREAAPVVVSWEGPQFVHFGMAVVNRELCRELARAPDVELTLITDPPADPGAPRDPRLEARVARERGGPVDVHVRHEWPPTFAPPRRGRWVLIQPWEFGSLPRAWIEPMNRLVDEIWVPSEYVRTSFVRSGVDPRRVVVVPNGVDPARFHPGAPPRELPTRKAFRFLFVGGTIPRKGIDILVETYLRTFRSHEDVCLVIKDLGADSFYRGQVLREGIKALAADSRHPEIIYLDDDLSEDALPGLYTACQCLVHPYRGEGFGLPILEAMACGLPVIVPGLGPAVEFCDPETAYLVPATEVRAPEARVGDLQTVERPWLVEVDRAALALAMRTVVERPDEARERGRQASERVRRDFSWSRIARVVRERLEVLASRPVRRSALVAAPRRRRELSVCMIVRDEEARLPACVASVRDIADELVIVDTGSTDRTAEVARGLGARVFHAPWRDDWAAARNASLAHATRDWILVIDADQTLDPASRDEVRRLIQHDAPIGFLLRQWNYTDENGTASVVEHLTVRLFPNHPVIRYAGRIHEQVVSLGPDRALELVPCGVVLHHHGYASAAARRRKAERDLPILERLVAEAPEEPFAAYNLGVTYYTLDRPAEAAAALRGAIALGARGAGRGVGSPAYLLSARVVLALALMAQGCPAEAAAVCREALRLAPDLADAWCTLGAAELRLGRPDAAQDAYARALGCTGRSRLAMADRAASGWKAWLGIGEAELLRGRWEQALGYLERAGALAPRAPEVQRALEAALGVALARGQDNARLHRLRGGLLAGRGDLDGALACLRRALELDDSDPATLGAAGNVLLALGAAREAEQAYLAAVTLRPGWAEVRQGLEAARDLAAARLSSPGPRT